MKDKIEESPKANERSKASESSKENKSSKENQSKWARILDVILIILLYFIVLREGMMAVITTIQTNYELTLGDMGLTIQQANIQGCVLAGMVFVLLMLSVMLITTGLKNSKELRAAKEILSNVNKAEKSKEKQC